MTLILAILTLFTWSYLILAHGRFWSAGPTLPPAQPLTAPPVEIIIPARDEAESIEATLRSLLAQDYRGPFHITLVDDDSTDATAALARAIDNPRLTVLTGAPRPLGWSGKQWALQQGISSPLHSREGPGVGNARTASGMESSNPAPLLFLTDADIIHDPTHLSTLVAKLEYDHLDMLSELVELRCTSPAERALVPAFVFFFQLLYPFAHVNDPAHRTAAAAGGTVLLRRTALDRIGGIEALRGALIDDVALAAALKPHGPIFLAHSTEARSLRPYPAPMDIWRMVARTAYVQLRFSPLLLLGTIIGLALVWLVPPALTLFAPAPARYIAASAWLASTLAYIPTLHRFRQSPLWALALPAIATFYLAATIGSAIDHHRGRGVVWKRRAYQNASV